MVSQYQRGNSSYIQNQLFLQLQRKYIYIKDKDLDKSKYKATNKDYLNVYIKNYMNDDPNISEEEKQRLIDEAKKLQLEQQNQDSQQLLKDEQEEVSSEKSKETKMLNLDRIKEIFDKMTLIDSDPNSKSAQDFYNNLEKLEKENQNKKKSYITIKTMKRNRTQVTEEHFKVGEKGQLERDENQKKVIDFQKYQFPEINPIDFRVQASEGSKDFVRLANYRYPSQIPQRKGIVIFIHGFTDYCKRYAYFAEEFTKNGYDFVGFDQKGFGLSEGEKGMLDPEEKMIKDHLSYVDLIEQNYGGQEVKKFIIGHSLGSLIALKMSVKSTPNKFSGLGLLTPFLGFKHKEDIEKLDKGNSILGKIMPSLQVVKIPVKKQPPSYFQSFVTDPLSQFKEYQPISNLKTLVKMQQKFINEEVNQFKTPFIMLLAGQDDLVCNKGAKQNFFDICNIQDKDLINYEDLTHFIIHDKEFLPLVQKDLISWLNTHS